MLKTYYFDAAAHEPPSPAALDAFQAALSLGNPSALHDRGITAKQALEGARESIAQDLNCLPEEVYFTSGATEACNWMMESLSAYTGKLTFPRRYEHHAVLEYPPVDHPHRTDRPGLTHMMANNETGEIFDIHSIRRNAHNALFACDATAAVGQIPVDFKALGVDYLAFGAHKFGGISGIGCLIVKKDTPLISMIRGGGQEWGKRGGTESVALACAMAAALHDRMGNMVSDMKRIARCRDLLITNLFRFVPDTYVNGPYTPGDVLLRLPGNANLSFLGVESQALVMALSAEGVYASSGSACTSGEADGSYVLRAMGYPASRARSAVRFTLPYTVTEDDILGAVPLIVSAVENLRRLTPTP
jgi:cysteine desulfurase